MAHDRQPTPQTVNVPGESGRRRPLKSFAGLRSVAVLSAIQLFTLAPAFSPSGIYAPQIAQAPFGPLILVALAVATGTMLTGALRLVRAALGSARAIQRAVTWLCVLAFTLLDGSVAYYSRFGTYPTMRLARDLVEAPGAFLAYTGSDVQPSDVITIVLAVAVSWAAAGVAIGDIWRGVPALRRGLAEASVGAVGFYALYSAPVTAQHSFLVAEHSLPAAKYLSATAAVLRRDGVESFERWKPTYVPNHELAAKQSPPRAKHVVLIIAEALRADRLPVYGYTRATTPFLSADIANWIPYTRAYSHASRTADSFPIIFNSRYFAAVDRTNDGATELWHSLRSHGVHTSFLSAGAIQWGGVTSAIDFRDIERTSIASDSPISARSLVTTLAFDYAVDDSVPLDKYRTLIAEDFRGGSSFVTLHFVGSHYPFHYDDTPDEFLPSMRQPAPARQAPSQTLQVYERTSETTRQRLDEISNSYDNSIRHIDGLLRRIVETLTEAGLLEDSIVIFTSDHGESLGEHATLFHGMTLYEEQVHVPLLIRVGSHLRAAGNRLATHSQAVAGQIDLMPTIHELLLPGAPMPQHFEGRSWLNSGQKPFELLLFRGIGEKVAFVSQSSKYIYDSVGRRAEEFDLQSDPAEQRNLWNDESGRTDATEFLVELKRQHPSWER